MSSPARHRLLRPLRPSLLLGVAGVVLGAASCTKSPPPLALGLMTDLVQVPDPLAKVQIVAKRDGRTVVDRTFELGEGGTRIALPYAYLLDMSDGDGATVRVDVTGTLESGRTLARAANLRSLPGATRFFRVALAAACLDVGCPSDMTCVEGRCEPLDFEGIRLPNYVIGMESTLQCSTTVTGKNTSTAVLMGLKAPGACGGTDACIEGTCYRPGPGCSNMTLDGWESDVDCGWACGPCGAGDDCVDGRDCESRVCGKDGRCAVAKCTDGVKNAEESDVDCGGPTCARCRGGAACVQNGDCRSAVCTAGRCAGPSCTDGAFNGAETDLDCGGPDCGPCALDKACAANTDCASAACEMKKCVPLFAEPNNGTTRVTTDMAPRGIVAADFDNDGRADLAWANSGSGTVSISIGRGDGTFEPRRSYTLMKDNNAKSMTPWSIRVADIDGDGRLDMLVSNASEGGGVNVLRGWGLGLFDVGPPLWMGGLTRSSAVADLNGDKIADLVSANYFGVALRLWSIFNGGWSGAFGAGSDLQVDYDSVAVEVGSINNKADAIPDIVVASEKPSTISVLLGQGNAQFTRQLERPMTTPLELKLIDVGFSPRDMRLVDANQDGFLDIVVAAATSNEVCVLLGQGTGVFNRTQHYPVPGLASQVGVADVNGDGRLDIVVAHNGLSVLLGQKDSVFAKPVTYTFAFKVNRLAVADLNVDGRPDLAVTGEGTDQAIILLNQSH